MTPPSLPPTVAAHVPTGILIDGAWRPAASGQHVRRQRPGHHRDALRRRRRRVRRRPRRPDGGVRRVPRVARHGAARALRAAARGLRDDHRAHRGHRRARDRRGRQAAGRVPRRGRLRRRLRPLVRRAGGPVRGPRPPRALGCQPPARPAPAGRTRAAHHAVELPDRDDRPQGRARARGRLQRRHQARAAHAADHRVRRRDHPRRARGARPAHRRDQRGAVGVGAQHLRPAAVRPAAAQALVHGLDRGRARALLKASADTSCAPRWSWAATRRSSSSRTPTSTPPSRAPCRPRCATPARRASPPTGSSCTRPSPRSSPPALTAAFDKLVVGHGADEGTTVGPLIEEAAVDRVEEVVAEAVDGGARVRIGGERPDRRGLLLRPDRARPRVARPARDHRGDVRARRAGRHVRLRGRGASRSPTPRRSAWSPTPTPATSRASCASRSRSTPGCSA